MPESPAVRRTASRLIVASALASLVLAAGPARADDDASKSEKTDSGDALSWRKEGGEAHGSQVSSSEWLPIMIGAAGGFLVGGLVGAGFDTAEPPVVGPAVGAGIGGFTGGAAGAWFIRSLREKDTRLAGTLTGLGVGAALGAIAFSKMEPDNRALETVGKWGSLVVFPVVGAIVGNRLAIVFSSPAPRDAAPPAPVATLVPVVAPVFGPQGSTGLRIGFDATF